MARRRQRGGLDDVGILARAAKQLAMGELEAARAGCDRVLKVRPRHIQALELRSLVAREEGEHALAVELLDRALAEGESASRWVARARSLLELARDDPQRDEEVMAALKRALALDPSDAETYAVEAELHKRRGDPAAAREALGGALALEPERVSYIGLEASLLLSDGDEDAALARFHDAVRARDGDARERARVLNAAAELHERRGELEDAAKARGLVEQLRSLSSKH